MKNKAAQSLGRRGGLAKSEAKSEAARANGAKGGRPSHRSQLVAKIREYIGEPDPDLTLSEQGLALRDIRQWMFEEAVGAERLSHSLAHLDGTERREENWHMMGAWLNLSKVTQADIVREARKTN
jgi:hypothetical protein